MERDYRKGPTSAYAYGTKAQKQGRDFREGFQERLRERDRQREMCDCRNPVPMYPKMGEVRCRICRKILKRGDADG